MKRIWKLLVVLMLATLVLTACSSKPTSMAVQLPPELVALVGIGLTLALTQLAKWVGTKIPGVDISGPAAVIASALASIVVMGINYLIGLVPAAYDGLLNAAFAFLIIFFGGNGAYSLLLRKKTKTESAPLPEGEPF